MTERELRLRPEDAVGGQAFGLLEPNHGTLGGGAVTAVDLAGPVAERRQRALQQLHLCARRTRLQRRRGLQPIGRCECGRISFVGWQWSASAHDIGRLVCASGARIASDTCDARGADQSR